MHKQVTLIKFGGSVITDKSIPNTVRWDNLRRLIREIKPAFANKDELIVLGHGSGSFAHVPATRYRTAEGFVDSQSVFGMALTQDSAAQLNRIVVQECLKEDLPAVSVYASNSILTNNHEVSSHYDDVFRSYLKHGLLPVTSGDVIADEAKGCMIWSADAILPFFAKQFLANGWNVKRLIHVTSTPGVFYDVNHPEKGVFAEVTEKNIKEVYAAIGDTRGFDVTGGMGKKVQESLDLAKQTGIETYILSGETPGLLKNCLAGKEWQGTRIFSE